MNTQLSHILPFTIPIMALLGTILAMWHASKLIGKKAAFEFLGIGFIIEWFLEDISVRWGIIFGFYRFSYLMGPKLDQIPFAIPISAPFIIYVCWIVTNLIIDGQPLPKKYTTARIIFGAVLGGMLMTTIDLSADPFCSTNGLWTWLERGPYYGVPLHNYIGWFITGLITYSVHGFMMRNNKESQSLLTSSSLAIKKWTIAPLVIYALLGITFMFLNFDQKLGLISFYVFGIPVLAAAWRWYHWYENEAVKE